jgi:hypothetical protein
MRVQNEILSNLKEEEILIERRIHRINTKYQDLIEYKLIPALRDYDIAIEARPSISDTTYQVYRGYDKDFEPINFIFRSENDELRSEDHKRWSLHLEISYKGQRREVGIIDIKSRDDLNRSFSLITQTLEDMGFTLRDDAKKEEPKEEPEEVDPDVKELLDYRNSLSESELVALEVDYE